LPTPIQLAQKMGTLLGGSYLLLRALPPLENKKAARMSGFLLELVELAGVEPASAIPTSSVLHA